MTRRINQFKQYGKVARHKIQARVWRGSVKISRGEYGDPRLRAYEGSLVQVGFDPNSPDCVWIHFEDGMGLMAPRIVKRGISGGGYVR